MLGYPKSKVGQLRNNGAARLLGIPSDLWYEFNELYEYLICDISFDVMNELYQQFSKQEEAKGVKNRRKLNSIESRILILQVSCIYLFWVFLSNHVLFVLLRTV